MGCYHPSQDDLDLRITAATQKKVREIDRHEDAVSTVSSAVSRGWAKPLG
jgi:hypothetical protein